MSDSLEKRYSQLMLKASEKLARVQADLKQIKQRAHEPIAIIGMGCRFPMSKNPESYWNVLADGVDTMREAPDWHRDYLEPYYSAKSGVPGDVYARQGGFLEQSLAAFDADFFRISPLEASSMDPQHRLLLEVTWEALEYAAIVPESLSGSSTGVFIGICSNDYAWQLVKKDPRLTDVYIGSGNAYSPAAGRISYLLDVHGPCMAVDTGCASSLSGVHLAVNSLRRGECDLALAGGVQRYASPEYWVNLCRSGMLSPDSRCKTFAEGANGYARGEGCGLIVLKRLSEAKADGDNICAVIEGSAMGHNGHTSDLTVPNGSSQQMVIRRALENARVRPGDIDYIEAHGTGTSLGDPVEINALGRVFRKRETPLLVGSAKTNIGHLEGASGISGLIKIVLSLQAKTIPKHLHFSEPSSYIDWDEIPLEVVAEKVPWERRGDKRRLAGLSSFGFEGVNVHAVISEAPDSAPRKKSDILQSPCHLVTLSAKSATALDDMAGRYLDYLEQHADLALCDVAFTTNSRRAHHIERLALNVSSVSDACRKLRAYQVDPISAGIFRGSNGRKKSKIAFLFTGQGSQYPGMGEVLYRTQPVYRSVVERCDQILRDRRLLKEPLLDVLYPAERASAPRLQEATYTQPALFVVEYALAALWESWGIRPAVVMGHSIGEYVAACVAGVFSLEDALTLIAHRGRLMQTLPSGGKMIALGASEAQVLQAIQGVERVSIAAINGPRSTVISGEAERLARVASALEAQGVNSKTLEVSHAFHSPLMEPMLDEFREKLGEVEFNRPRVDFVSNVTGVIETASPSHADYWVNHVLAPVRFMDGMNSLAAHEAAIFLELGPAPILSGMSRHVLSDEAGLCLPTLTQGKNDWRVLLSTLGELYVRGVVVDWQNFHREFDHRPVALPTYSWQRNEYWVAFEPTQAASVPETHKVLLGERVHSPALKAGKIVYQRDLSPQNPSYLAEHRIHGQVVLPTAVYVEMLLIAGKQIYSDGRMSGDKPIAVEELLVLDPLVWVNGNVRTLQVILTPVQEHYSFEVLSLASNNVGSGAWVCHAVGSMSVGASERTQPDLVTLRRGIDQAISLGDFYRFFRKSGVEFGVNFRGVKEVWRDSENAQALGRVQISTELLKGQNNQLHPTLLDGCLQLLSVLLHDDGFRCIGCKRFSFFGGVAEYQPEHQQLWCHVEIHSQEEASVTADFLLFAENGPLVASIEEFRVGTGP